MRYVTERKPKMLDFCLILVFLLPRFVRKPDFGHMLALLVTEIRLKA